MNPLSLAGKTHDGSFRDYTCRNPFENVEILPRGEVYTCCSAYLKHNYAIGNIFNEDFQEIWNSEKARRLRRSVQEGNFEFCQKYCKCLYDAAKNRKSIGIHQPVVLKKMQRVLFSMKRQRNMRCIIRQSILPYPAMRRATCAARHAEAAAKCWERRKANSFISVLGKL